MESRRVMVLAVFERLIDDEDRKDVDEGEIREKSTNRNLQVKLSSSQLSREQEVIRI
jgi:hypothetical protein